MSDFPISPDEAAAMGLSPEDMRAPYGGGYNPAPGTMPAPRGKKPNGKKGAADRVRALASKVSAERQALLDSIDSKLVRSNYMGIPDKSLIPMADLGKVGFTSKPNAQGIPYGLDPMSLSAEERAYLGIPQEQLAALTGGGQ